MSTIEDNVLYQIILVFIIFGGGYCGIILFWKAIYDPSQEEFYQSYEEWCDGTYDEKIYNERMNKLLCDLMKIAARHSALDRGPKTHNSE